MAKFNDYSDEVIKKIEQQIGDALTEIGMFVTGEAKLRCPVDTGNLRGSIANDVKEKENRVDIGTDVDYAVYVEKGTSRQNAQQFLTPAVEENVQDIMKLAEKHIGRDG